MLAMFLVEEDEPDSLGPRHLSLCYGSYGILKKSSSSTVGFPRFVKTAWQIQMSRFNAKSSTDVLFIVCILAHFSCY
jgi:hypothetical protein